MRQTPKVFISSVVVSLEEHRERIYEIITNEFHWLCNASGISDQAFGGPPKTACFNAIEDSDLYLGVFWKRSGSLVIPHNLFMTEMEFYHALNLRKSMRIYVLEAQRRDEYLRLFLDHITNEPEEGQYIRFCKDMADLLRKIREDLKYFGDRWFKGRTPWIPSIFLEAEMQNIGVLSNELLHYNIKVPARNKIIYDPDWTVERVAIMQEHYEKLEFPQAFEVGASILQAFLSNRLLLKNKEFLSLWADFLRMWAGSCTWLGKVDDNFGALWAAKQRRQTYRILEAWSEMNESTGLITNCFYVHANMKKIKAAYTNSPTWQVYFEGQHKFALQRAAAYDEEYIARVAYPSSHSHRPYILRELGEYDQAISDLEKRMIYTSNTNEMSFINLKAQLGTTIILKGKERRARGVLRDGMRLLREAESEVKEYYSSPYYLTVMKKVAMGVLLTGETDEAKQMLHILHADAFQRKLFHQAWAIHAILCGAT
jgi:hypothetical protein